MKTKVRLAHSIKHPAAVIETSGLSTAEKVTDISGRGVGMDAVKALIENHGGKVQGSGKNA